MCTLNPLDFDQQYSPGNKYLLGNLIYQLGY